MLIAWLFFGFSWFVTLIVIPVAIIIATPIFRISIAHSVNRENDEEVPLGISKAMYLEGAHIEMLVLVSSSVFVFVVEIFLRDLAVRALDELPELLLISAKALIIVTPLLILTYRFLANATLSTISGVYIAAFDADLREDNSSQPTS